MEGKSSFLTGEVSHLIPNTCSDTRVRCEKSAEAIVVMMSRET
jgi:hypothetical protein